MQPFVILTLLLLKPRRLLCVNVSVQNHTILLVRGRYGHACTTHKYEQCYIKRTLRACPSTIVCVIASSQCGVDDTSMVHGTNKEVVLP